MKIFYFITAISFALLTGCSPKISKTITKSVAPLDYRQEVIVFDLDDSIPANSVEIGTLKIGDTGFTVNCGWERILNDAKLETRKMGGNALKIVKHGYPNPFGSTCHRITGNVLIIDESACKPVAEPFDSTLLKSNYALIHLFRSSGMGSLINYDVHLGDSVIWRASANSRTTVKITSDGLNSIWAKTESKSEVPVNIKIGQEYYVRCGVTMGAFVGRPKIEMVDNIVGRLEFKGLQIRKSAKHDLISLNDGREIECIIKKEDDVNVYITLFQNNKSIETSIDKASINTIQRAE